MVRIAPVDLQFNPKTLWFDAGELEIEAGSSVVVTTARGTEFGRLASEVFEASDEQVSKLKTALKPVVRVATEEDEQNAAEMEQRSKDAMPVFREMAEELAPDMRPVSVEYLLDGDKAIFYFESEDRIDFRDLVRKLAAHFHVRVDMRQIGVRDEARMVGGLGHCGQELCCKRLGGEFCPVSIRMAKEQDLSLNPQKISGVCGRLMCCLRYEFDAYKDFKSRAPKVGATIQTPDGVAKVTELDVPRELVTLKLDEEKPVKVPLCEFEPAEEAQNRPSAIGKDAWEAAHVDDVFDNVSAALVSFSHKQLSDGDKLAKPVAVTRKTEISDEAAETSSRKSRRRRSTKLSKDGASASAQGGGSASTNSKSSKKHNVKGAKADARSQKSSKTSIGSRSGNASSQSQRKNTKEASGVRPGQRSSALRRKAASSDQKYESKRKQNSPSSEANTGSDSKTPSSHRRSRRRSHTSGAASSSDASNSAK